MTKNLSAAISTLTHKPFYRQSSTPLGAAAVLYNPHSRGLCAAPRFSPTRFIPPSHLIDFFRNLICFQALGIKRYTLGMFRVTPLLSLLAKHMGEQS
jgi:hypothetical protein